MNLHLLLLMFGTFATGTNALIMTGILPIVADGLDTTPAIAGLSVTVFALAYALSAPLLPVLLARFERRTIMVISLIALVLGTLASIAAQDITTFLITRAIVGFGSAAFTPQASAVAVGMVPPERRGRAITMVLLGITAASAIGVPIGTVVGNAWGYRAALLVVAALGVLAIVGILFVPKTPKPVNPGFAAQLAPLRRPAVLAVAGTTALVTTGFFAISIYFAPLLFSTAGLDSSALAVVLAAFGVAGIASLLFGGRYIDRFGGFRITAVSLVVITIGTPMFGVATNLWWILLLVVPWGVFGSIIIPAQQYELGRLDPDNPAPVFALNSSAIYAGTALGGLVGSVSMSVAPVQWLVVVAAVPLLLALLATLAQLARARRGVRPAEFATASASAPELAPVAD